METNDQSKAGETKKLEGGFSEALGTEPEAIRPESKPMSNNGCTNNGCGVKQN